MEHLETLYFYIFGWNADYIPAFQKMLEAEEVEWELEVPVRTLFDPAPELYVPQPARRGAAAAESWVLEPGLGVVELDLTARVTAISASAVRRGVVAPTRLLDFSTDEIMGLVDLP